MCFELSCKKHTHHAHTHMDAYKNSDEYSIVGFCKDASIITVIIIVNVLEGQITTMRSFVISLLLTMSSLSVAAESEPLPRITLLESTTNATTSSAITTACK